MIKDLFFGCTFFLRACFFGWGLFAMKPIAIKRGSGRKAVTQLVNGGMKRLREGLSVAIFPEGTRTRATAPGKYKIGGAVLAAESGYPVIPVAHNAGEFWPRKGFIKRPGHITVRIGPAIETAGKKPEDILSEAKAWIEARLDIEIHRVECIALDELAARFNLIAHQSSKDLICRNGVFDLHLQQAPAFYAQRGFPELLRIHFPQTLVTLDVLTTLGLVEQPVDGLFK